jgi:hypothetical protein
MFKGLLLLTLVIPNLGDDKQGEEGLDQKPECTGDQCSEAEPEIVNSDTDKANPDGKTGPSEKAGPGGKAYPGGKADPNRKPPTKDEMCLYRYYNESDPYWMCDAYVLCRIPVPRTPLPPPKDDPNAPPVSYEMLCLYRTCLMSKGYTVTGETPEEVRRDCQAEVTKKSKGIKRPKPPPPKCNILLIPWAREKTKLLKTSCPEDYRNCDAAYSHDPCAVAMYNEMEFLSSKHADLCAKETVDYAAARHIRFLASCARRRREFENYGEIIDLED